MAKTSVHSSSIKVINLSVQLRLVASKGQFSCWGSMGAAVPELAIGIPCAGSTGAGKEALTLWDACCRLLAQPESQALSDCPGIACRVPTLEGEAEVKVRPGTQPGQRLRMRGYGIPHVHNPQAQGRPVRGDQRADTRGRQRRAAAAAGGLPGRGAAKEEARSIDRA